ncbi:hypothetical protein ACTNBP_12270 [Oliverpabstia intestinalis]|uniref:hypothetical protein n=1 Tax=Oliverpabstia intestinalis TaxID=2606633 RepID=UPI003F8C82F8
MKIEIAEPGRMTQTGSSLLKLIQNNNMPVLDLLVRESIQNSLDARKDGSKYVEVDYLTGKFDSVKLREELEGITKPLIKRFPENEYDFIAVKDSNTVGLTGEMNYKKVKNNDYGNLLKLIYEICKPQENEGAGGSWGIGKTVYFRIGIGLVIYYSRIKEENGQYASRLAASYVENETKDDAMIPIYKDQSKRGIAWWGEQVGENLTQPITDEKYISQFLQIFGIDQYEEEETGTTIIIPYIDTEKLLTSNRIEYFNGKGMLITPYWCNTLEDYLTIAVQRWYAPRLNNRHYNLGAFLRMKINDKGIGLDTMEPVFKVIQALYNRANYVKDEDIFTNSDIEVKIESVNLRGCLSETSSGKVAFAKVPRKILGMEAPLNKPEPFMYLNCEIRDEDVNRPVVCFVRKPAMIVSYENVGAWVSNIPTTSKDEYIIAIYVLNSSNNLKGCPTEKSLEEYIRRSEMADHTSWEDWSEGSYNPRIITKIQNGVNKLISKEFVTEVQTVKPKINSGLGKMFGDMLLPPDGFGKRPGPDHKPGQGQNSFSRKGFHFKVEDEKIKYLPTGMIVSLILETSRKNKIIGTAFQIQVDSESKKIEISEWESKMGLITPFDIQDARIEALMIDGQVVNKTEILSHDDDTINISNISFSKLKSSKGTCYGLRVFSDTPLAIKIRMNVTIKTNRKDVKPAFVFEKEEAND